MVLWLVFAPAPWAEVRSHLAIASDYVFRGLLKTAGGLAYQGSAEYLADTGLYGGVWASRVDYARELDERDAEVDYFVGYQRRLSSDIAYDATLVRYTYMGSSPVDYDWTELQLTAHVLDRWSIGAAVGDDLFGRGERNYHGELTYRHPLPVRVVLDATVGYEWLDRVVGTNYGFAELGVARRIGAFEVRLAFVATDSGADMFGAAADDHWVITLSWLSD